MTFSLTITNGASIISTAAGSGFALASWAPQIAGRRTNQLGGRGPYSDVVEEIVINVYGSSVTDKLDIIQSVFERTAAWERREIDAIPTTIQAAYTGGETWTAFIVGQDGDAPYVTLPENYVQYEVQEDLDGIILRFRRTGLWIGDEDVTAVTQETSMATIPSKHTLNSAHTDGKVAVPFTLKMTFDGGYAASLDDSYILLSTGATSTDAEGRLAIQDASGYTFSATNHYSTAADATYKSYGGNFLMFEPYDTTEQAATMNTGLASGTRRWGVLACMSSLQNFSTQFTARVAMRTLGGDDVYTPTVVVDNTQIPKWYFLGAVDIGGDEDTTRLLLKADTSAGDGTDFVKIDAMAYVALDDPGLGRLIAMRRRAPAYFDETITNNSYLIPESEFDTGYDPAINLNIFGGDEVDLDYRGDLYTYFSPQNEYICAMFLATRGASTGLTPNWRMTDASNNVIDVKFGIDSLYNSSLMVIGG